jgi:hypothetical protein
MEGAIPGICRTHRFFSRFINEWIGGEGLDMLGPDTDQDAHH